MNGFKVDVEEWRIVKVFVFRRMEQGLNCVFV